MSYVPVYKGRFTEIFVHLGIDITGHTLVSEIRAKPDPTAELIKAWTITVIDAATGEIKMSIDDTSNTITHTEGFMDMKRVISSVDHPVFDDILFVKFIPAVTA